MGTELTAAVANYRLVYFQPDPENGDRVCVGLLFDEGDGTRTLMYDSEFSKVRCVAPQIDVEMVRFYCEDLRSSLRRSKDPDVTLKKYSPQLTTSSSRSIATSTNDSVRLRLLERFAVSSKAHLGLSERSDVVVERKQSADEIAAFVETIAAPLKLPIVRNARPEDLFGKRVPLIGSVAVGVRGPSGVVLIDGVNFKTTTPKRGINATNKVVHTFWQYGRLRETDLALQPSEFKRVGVVLNGAKNTSPKKVAAYADAHDYALDLFKKESEMALDAASGGDRERLLELLQS